MIIDTETIMDEAIREEFVCTDQLEFCVNGLRVLIKNKWWL